MLGSYRDDTGSIQSRVMWGFVMNKMLMRQGFPRVLAFPANSQSDFCCLFINHVTNRRYVISMLLASLRNEVGGT
jgi:hypothetical protein